MTTTTACNLIEEAQRQLNGLRPLEKARDTLWDRVNGSR